jgi:YhcH/YjgK/YiaL family protein
VVARYKTKPRPEGRWEAHRKYIDIQFLAAGKELIGVTAADKLTITDAYNEESDIMFFGDSEGDFITLTEDKFVLLFPQDAHMPCITANTPSDVIKVVVKIMV